MKKQIRIGILFVALAIIAANSLLLFVPSARIVKHGKILDALSKKYKSIDPKALQPVLAGSLVTVANNFQPIQPDECALIYIWAPIAGSTDSYRIISGLSYPTQVGMRGQMLKKETLIAPDASAVGWSLLGKLHLAYSLQHITTNALFGETGQLAADPKKGMAILQKKWEAVPKEIQVQANLMLTQNREIAKKFSKEGLILQTGLGSFYDIDQAYPDKVLTIISDNLPSRPTAK